MACDCPAEIISDLDNLPKPVGYTVQKTTGACLDGPGDWLYGVVSSAGAFRILRWPWPALDSYEEIVAAEVNSGSIGGMRWPCVVDSTIYWLEAIFVGSDFENRVYSQPIAGGSATLVYTHAWTSAEDSFLWGTVPADGKVWVAFYRFSSGFTVQETGVIDTSTGTVHGYSNGGSSAHHLLGSDPVCVATDDAIWAMATGTGDDRLCRFDTGALTWTDTDGSGRDLQTPAPLSDGEVRAWDLTATEAVHVAADLTITVDPCMAGLDDLSLAPQEWVAWNADHTIVAYKMRSFDRYVASDCAAAAARGWAVGTAGWG